MVDLDYEQIFSLKDKVTGMDTGIKIQASYAGYVRRVVIARARALSLCACVSCISFYAFVVYCLCVLSLSLLLSLPVVSLSLWCNMPISSCYHLFLAYFILTHSYIIVVSLCFFIFIIAFIHTCIHTLEYRHMIGGAIWKIFKDDAEEIIYAVDYNISKERHVPQAQIEVLAQGSRPVTTPPNHFVFR